jgi:CspA family cold shock protein
VSFYFRDVKEESDIFEGSEAQLVLVDEGKGPHAQDI